MLHAPPCAQSIWASADRQWHSRIPHPRASTSRNPFCQHLLHLSCQRQGQKHPIARNFCWRPERRSIKPQQQRSGLCAAARRRRQRATAYNPGPWSVPSCEWIPAGLGLGRRWGREVIGHGRQRGRPAEQAAAAKGRPGRGRRCRRGRRRVDCGRGSIWCRCRRSRRRRRLAGGHGSAARIAGQSTAEAGRQRGEGVSSRPQLLWLRCGRAKARPRVRGRAAAQRRRRVSGRLLLVEPTVGRRRAERARSSCSQAGKSVQAGPRARHPSNKA